jgi:hypothetical protein
MNNRYYTYAYLCEDGTPYYIGKGKENRAFKKHSVGTPPRDRILFLKKNLTEKEAFAHEMYMIDVLGRIDLGTGILKNKNAGGNGSSGKVYSQEERDRIRKDVLGRKWWNNGIENTQSKKCPGDGWVTGRLVTWNEKIRLENMKNGASKITYKLIHENGEVVYCKNLNDLKRKCKCDETYNPFYKIMYKQQKSYKGWISVERCDNIDIELNDQKIIDLCNSYLKKTYKITHRDGRVLYTRNITKLGKEYGSADGFCRVMRGKRKSYNGWISVEVL